jgi:mannose-6-phosphate isomerase-like protein (cupin superfamily)
MHFHTRARQFFYILDGEGTMVLGDQVIVLKRGQGIEIAPQIYHEFKNQSTADVHFLVISVPSTRRDRVNIDQATASAGDGGLSL